MNSVNIIGNLTKDPELKHTKGGKAVTTFTLAFTNYDKTSSYFSVAAFDKVAENCAKYLEKASKVGVSGYLKQQIWEAEDSDGKKIKRSRIDIIATTVTFLSTKIQKDQNEDGSDVIDPF